MEGGKGPKETGSQCGRTHLADKDKGLPPRPPGTAAEALHQLADEVHPEGGRRGPVQLPHHLANLGGHALVSHTSAWCSHQTCAGLRL